MFQDCDHCISSSLKVSSMLAVLHSHMHIYTIQQRTVW